MDGQDPRRGGYSDDPSYTNQQSPYDTPQNGQSNYGDLSGNRLSQSQQRPNLAITSSQPNGSIHQPYGGGYYAANSSVAGVNALSQGAYQQNNYASAGPSRQHNPQSYCHRQQFSAAPSYQAAQQPMLLNPSQYDTSQQYQQPRQPPQLHMLQNDAFTYDLGQDQTDLPLLPLPPPAVTTSYLPGRAPAAYAPQAPLAAPPPPQPQQVLPIHQPIHHQQSVLPGLAHMNRSVFEQELDQVYTDLRPIVQIINNDGNLKPAINALFRTTETFIEAAEEMSKHFLAIIVTFINRGRIDFGCTRTRGQRLWTVARH